MELIKFEQNKFIPITLEPKPLLFLSLPHREALYGGAAGGGKLSSLEASVSTPHGWKKVKHLKVGDYIHGDDGKLQKVVLLHPPIEVPKWTVYFSDGTKSEHNENHLWEAWRSRKGIKKSGKRVFGRESAEVVTTKTLKDWVDQGYKPQIPVCSPVEYNPNPKTLPKIDPYLLGVLLGDGCISSSSITITADEKDHAHYLSNFGTKDITVSSGDLRFTGNRRKECVESLEYYSLLGTKSDSKFIPKHYLFGTVDCRLSILQGLMDTDGHNCSNKNQCEYTSVSKDLAEGVCHLVRSLGGTAKITSKKGSYVDRKGIKVLCKDVFRVWIRFPDDNLFRLKRKQKGVFGRNLVQKTVTDVKVEGSIVGRCLTVSNPNGLYITDDFIVTHNSEALLAAALQYCHIPGYSAILFRRSLQEHKMANNLIPRAKKWLAPYLRTKEVTWNAQENEFTFKTKNWDGSEGAPAILKYGYCDQADSHLRYQGGEFQFIGWDEVTHIKPDMYEYLFSRLRKNVCPVHKLKDGEPNYVDDCGLCQQAKAVPLRIRSATNPGSRSHQYIKDRFRIERDPISGEFIGNHPDRPFIPAFVKDNPHIDQKEYLRSLEELDPVKRDQLMNGDWDASPDSLYRKEHLRHYKRRGDYIVFDGESFRPDEMRWFFTMDCAATQAELIERGDESVIGFWGLSPKYHLGLFDACIFKKEIPDLVEEAVALFRRYHHLLPENFSVEKNGLGIGVCQSMKARGLPVLEVHKSKDKVQFAQKGVMKMSQGRIFFPEDYRDWKNKVEGQLFVWQGLKDEPDDIVDMVSLAAHYVDWTVFDATGLSNAKAPETQLYVPPSPAIGVTSNIPMDFPNFFN